MTDRIADSFADIRKRLDELTNEAWAKPELEINPVKPETATDIKTGKHYRWTGQSWIEESDAVPDLLTGWMWGYF